MRLKLLLPGLFLLTGLFCEAQSGVTLSDSIFSGNVYRKFRIYVPNIYSSSKPAPLVLNLHGLAMNATQQQVYSDFMPIADTAGFLMVLPEGVISGSTQFWNVGVVYSPNDVGFLKDLIDSVSQQYNINQDMVYSCGLSNGGIMSYYLTCQLPGKFAAIASVAGTMFRPWFSTCNPSMAVPVMEIHGTTDGTIPYEGNSVPGSNGLYMPIDTVIDKWVWHNQCHPHPNVNIMSDINTTDFSTVEHFVYLGGADGSTVELYKVIDGSHSWPGAQPVVFHTNEDFNASVEIWRFFRKYKRQQFVTNVGIDERQLTINNFSVWPNPVQSVLHWNAPEGNMYKVFSVDGYLLMEGSGNFIDVSQFANGLYFLKVSDAQSSNYMKFIKE